MKQLKYSVKKGDLLRTRCGKDYLVLEVHSDHFYVLDLDELMPLVLSYEFENNGKSPDTYHLDIVEVLGFHHIGTYPLGEPHWKEPEIDRDAVYQIVANDLLDLYVDLYGATRGVQRMLDAGLSPIEIHSVLGFDEETIDAALEEDAAEKRKLEIKSDK